MPKSILSQQSFASGEWSPKLDARTDQQRYTSAMRKARNVITYKQGGFTRRPGTQMIEQAKKVNTAGHDYGVRMVPFTFSPTTTFMLEFGDHYIRFYSNGEQVNVVAADLPFWIIVNAYTAGQYVQYLGVSYYCIQDVPAQIPPFGNNPPPSAPTQWVAQTILEQPTPYNADCGASGPQPGNVWGTDIWELSFCQINDVIYITHPDYPVYSLTRFSDTDWVMAEVDFLTPALLDQNVTDTQITASATTGNGITLTVTAPAFAGSTYYSIGNSVEVSGVIYVCVTAYVSTATFANDLAAGYWQEVDVFNSQHVGSTWQLAYLRPSAYLEVVGNASTGFSDGTSGTIQVLGDWEVHTYGVWSSDIAIERSLDGGQVWDTVRSVTGRSDRNVDITGTALQLGLYRIVITNSAALVNPGATNPRVVFEAVDSFLYGLVKITAVGSATSATADVVTELANTSPTQYWSEAAWSDYRGYPQAVTSFQQRIIYGGSGYEPQRIWGTVTNDIENFALGDQTRATDGFAFDLNAPSRGPIEWLIAQTDLFVGFSGAEWVVNSGSTNTNGQSSGAAITATNINAVEHSTWGSAANVAPAIVGDAVLYTQRQATSLKQMMFSIYTTKYMSQDLTVMADHLFASGIVQLCYMTRWRKQSIIWAVTQQGILCGMTYDLDQEVFGWHEHQTGYGQTTPEGVPIDPDNGFESVAVIYGKGLDDDEVWVVANRLVEGVKTRFIERINPYNWEEAFTEAPNPPAPDLSSAFYVDCGTTITSPGSLTLTGLDYLEGRYVVGLGDGAPFGPLLVSDGSVTLPASIPTTVETVNIGLPIRYYGQPMRFDADARAGNTQALIKQISNVYLRVWNSNGGNISNGTEPFPLWVSGTAYAVGDNVRSPLTQLGYNCVVANSGNTDPSVSSDFVVLQGPTYQREVPIPYSINPTNPLSLPALATVPTDIRITPMLNPYMNADPIVIVTGNDARPLTVLALIIHYEIISVP